MCACNVTNNGTVLEYSVLWPTSLINMDVLHKMRLLGKGNVPKIENYHLMLKGFAAFFKNLRRPSDNLVETKARIYLPVKVESRFDLYSLAWNDSSAVVLYVILSSPAEKHRVAVADPWRLSNADFETHGDGRVFAVARSNSITLNFHFHDSNYLKVLINSKIHIFRTPQRRCAM